MSNINIFNLFGTVSLKDEASKTLDSIGDKAESTKGKLSGFQDGMKTIGDKAGAAGKYLTKNVTGPMLAVGAAAGVAISKFTSMGDNIHKASQRVGVSAKAYQELDYWAGQNGISQQGMEKAVGRLNQRIGEARSGNEKYSEAMREMGVDMKALEDGTLSTEAAFEQSIEGLMKMTNGQDKAALAGELFGKKMGEQMLPALNDTRLSVQDAKKNFEELGMGMGDDAVNASAAYQDAMDDLKRSMGGVVNTLVGDFIPVLVDQVIPAIQEYVIPAIGKFADGVSDLINWFTDLSPTMKKVIGGIMLFAVTLGPALIFVGKLATAISAITGLFAAGTVGASILTGVLGALGAVFAFITSPIGLVILAIAAVGVALTLLYKNSETFRNGVKKVFESVRDFMVNPIESAKQTISNIVDSIKGFFSNMKLSMPEIKMPKLPKFEMKGKFSLAPPSVPKLGINWNAEGGIFDKATIFNTNKGLQGVGEAGAEAIMPLDKLKDWIGKWMGVNNNNVEDAIRNMGSNIASKLNTPKLATTGPQVNNYTFNISGDWTVDSDERQDEVMDEFSKSLDRYFRVKGDK